MIEWSDEQLLIISHDATRNCRILAGPGTGKSTTVIALTQRILEETDDVDVSMVTFTRAATSELASKALEGSLQIPVSTVHSLALRILLANLKWMRLDQPLRVPDDWEFDVLIHEDIKQRLSSAGWNGMRKDKVKKLEREMAAQWESLNPEIVLDSTLDPELRNAFVSMWQRQRRVFGYSTYSQMPWYALEMVEDHPDANLLDIDVLVVDEYQDLNRCEINLLQQLNARGVVIIAVGDDEQSIYSWRVADPAGIKQFGEYFLDFDDYTLSISQRCGSSIIAASQDLISTSPLRIPGRPLVNASDRNPIGVFGYFRYPSAQQERSAVVELIQDMISDGISVDEIAILFRNDYQHRWSRPIGEILALNGIPFTDVESIGIPLTTNSARAVLAWARLVLDANDDLAWWTLLSLENGISDAAIRLIADSASESNLRFHEQLDALKSSRPEGMTTTSWNKTQSLCRRIHETLRAVGEPPKSDGDWVSWLEQLALQVNVALEPDLIDLLRLIASEIQEEIIDLAGIVGRLEPLSGDIALREGGIRILTIARSKGLTFEATLTMGVEDELFPSPRSLDPEEDRRLLYVAMTRAKQRCYLTMARYRNDGTSSSGSGTIDSRSRVTFLSDAGIRPTDFERDAITGRIHQS